MLVYLTFFLASALSLGIGFTVLNSGAPVLAGFWFVGGIGFAATLLGFVINDFLVLYQEYRDSNGHAAE